MSFLGKEYVFERQENFEGLVASMGLSPEQTQGFINQHPNQKLVKNGDTYTLTTSKELTFKSGVTFEEPVTGRTAQTTITLEGNTLTQIQKFEEGAEIKIVREFSDTELVVTITFTKFDGVARRYYKA